MKALSLKLLLCGAVAVQLCACNKVENSSDGFEAIDCITYSIAEMTSGNDEDPQTKVTVSGSSILWAEGDSVGIYPNQGSQVYFTIEESGSTEADFDGGGWAFRYGSTYSAYYPFIGDIYLDRTGIPVSYTGQEQTSTSGTGNLGSYIYMYTEPTSAVSGKLNFSFKHLCCLLKFNLTLPAGTYTKLAISIPDRDFVKKGHYNLTGGSCEIVGDEFTNQLQIDLDGITLSSDSSFTVIIASAPVDLNGKQVVVSVLDSQKKERQCKKSPTFACVAGKFYTFGCSSWTEVPQNMGVIISDWGSSGTIGGDAE